MQRFGSVIFFTDPDPIQESKADPDPGEILHAYNKKMNQIFFFLLYLVKKTGGMSKFDMIMR